MGNLVVPVIDHFERFAEDRIVATTLDGQPAFAFTVRPGDVLPWDVANIAAHNQPNGPANERCEISYAAAPSGEKGKSLYSVTDKTGFRSYRVKWKFLAGWPMVQRWASLLQFHSEDNGPGAGFGGVGIHDDSIDVGDPSSADGTKFIARIPIAVELEYDIRLDINWASGPDGFVRVFSEDVLLGEYKGLTVAAGSYRYLKQGLYRDPNPSPGTVIQTQVTIGTEEAVKSPVNDPVKAEAWRVELVDQQAHLSNALAQIETLKVQATAVIGTISAEADSIVENIKKMRDDVVALLNKGR